MIQRGQAEFDEKNYDEAIRIWSDGKKSSDAAKCPALDGLIEKAQTEEQNRKAEQASRPQAEQPAPPRPDMVFIRGGAFTMGCTSEQRNCDSNESPTFEATVSDFYLGRYEVTFEEYDAFCAATGREKPDDEGWGRGKRPVINVSWYDAVEYCNWLSEQHGLTPYYAIDKSRKDPNNENSLDDVKWTVTPRTGSKGYRLPTEAEWEYAARGGAQSKGYKYAGSSNLDEVAWFWENSEDKTNPAGQKKPNELGLHDMSGNVWEWCWDWYGEYSSGAKTNPRGAERGSSRVLRGGSWNNEAEFCRVSLRSYYYPDLRTGHYGFRVALVP